MKTPKPEKASKKEANILPKSNTESKARAKKASKSKPKKKASKAKPKKAAAVASSSLDVPSTVRGQSILEILAMSPKVAGVLPRPRFVPIQNHHIVGVEVEDARVDLVKPFMDYPQGQHVVAIFIPLEHSTEAAQWLALNSGMDLMQAPKQSDWKEREVSTAFMAELLGFTSKRRIQQLALEGHLKKNSRGRYDLNKSIKLYIQHLKDEAAGKGGPLLAEEKLEIAKIDRKTKDLEYRKKAEELTDVASAKKAGLEMGLKVSNELSRWSGLYGTKLVKAKTKLEVTKIITMACSRLQEELSKDNI